MPRKPQVNACRMHVSEPRLWGLKRTLPDPCAAVDRFFFFFVSDIIVPQSSAFPHELPYNHHLLYCICYLHKVIEKKSLSSLLRHVWSTPKAIDCALLLGCILSLDSERRWSIIQKRYRLVSPSARSLLLHALFSPHRPLRSGSTSPHDQRGKARLWTSPLIMTSWRLMPWV